jgi:hypothetical protein
MVASQGLAQALSTPDMHDWAVQNEHIVDDPGYHHVVIEQLRVCHGGRSEEAYQRMYEASLFRDEGMAKIIAAQLAPSTDSGRVAATIVSYTGGGHIQFNLPVPDRVRRRLARPIRQASVYMTSFMPGSSLEEVNNLIEEAIADYIWLTPVGTQGLPKRCR